MVQVSSEELEAKLKLALNAEYCKVFDESDGCGSKFIVTLVSR